VDFTRGGAVRFDEGSIVCVECSLRGFDCTVPQAICGVFLWNRLLEVFDSVLVRRCFSFFLPRNAGVFYFGFPFGVGAGGDAVYQFDRCWLLVGGVGVSGRVSRRGVGAWFVLCVTIVFSIIVRSGREIICKRGKRFVPQVPASEAPIRQAQGRLRGNRIRWEHTLYISSPGADAGLNLGAMLFVC